MPGYWHNAVQSVFGVGSRCGVPHCDGVCEDTFHGGSLELSENVVDRNNHLHITNYDVKVAVSGRP